MIPFSKMNGLGNKIIVADMRQAAVNITSAAAIALAGNIDTAFDQIMAVHKATLFDTDYKIEIWNADGSMAQACGNGTRCVVEWLYAQKLGNHFIFDTKGGVIEAQRQQTGLISVDMGIPRLNWQNIPVSREIADTNHVAFDVGPLKDACLVSMGNPHAIFFVGSDIQSLPLDTYGRILEHDPLFPERCNISIAEVTSSKSLTLRTWERGAGLTLACGTAACASLVAANRRGLTARHATITVPGGDLNILWRDDDHIIMTGPTEFEFNGQFDPLSGTYIRDQD